VGAGVPRGRAEGAHSSRGIKKSRGRGCRELRGLTKEELWGRAQEGKGISEKLGDLNGVSRHITGSTGALDRKHRYNRKRIRHRPWGIEGLARVESGRNWLRGAGREATGAKGSPSQKRGGGSAVDRRREPPQNPEGKSLGIKGGRLSPRRSASDDGECRQEKRGRG